MNDSQSTHKTHMKRQRGQFYTTNYEYILEGLPRPPHGVRCVIEPFVGEGHLLQWIGETPLPIEAYDIEPKYEGAVQHDTLLNPPDYENTWVITNPPFLARNKSSDKTLFDKYNTNDLYKCFLLSLGNCAGGVLILPSGFFLSPRDVDVRCRESFMSRFRISKVRYFEETVFADTTTTVVAFAFERSETPLTEQQVEWTLLPSKETRTYTMSAEQDWIIGGDIYKLSVPTGIQIRRHVEGQPLRPNEQQTFLTLNALDSGTQTGRICIEYKPNYVYPAKDCSRTYATLRITGKTLNEEEQKDLAVKFNTFLEKKREETWSLFLPQYRESKEYARKRIPFELAYIILCHLLG